MLYFFITIDSLEDEQRPPKALIMQWWGSNNRVSASMKWLNWWNNDLLHMIVGSCLEEGGHGRSLSLSVL